jgi:hypothetical protein
LFGDAPEIAGGVEYQVAVGELAVASIESRQIAQHTFGRILINNSVAE